jgi:hypothetical protein
MFSGEKSYSRDAHYQNGESSMLDRTLLAAVAIVAVSAPAAHAYVITTTNTGTIAGNPAQEVFSESIQSGGSQTSFTTNWFVAPGTNGLPSGEAISGTGVFQILNFTTTDLTLQITLTNDTVLPAPSNSNFNDARITAIGLDVDPSVTGASLTTSGAVFDHLTTTGNFPAFKEVDVCIFSGINCAGGGASGLSGNGASETFAIDLTGSFGPDLQHLSVDLSDLSTKWQGSSPLSFELAGGPGSPGGSTPLPEPGTLALLGSFLIGLFLVRRRKVTG